MKTAEEKRFDDCYGDCRCWNNVRVKCPVADECEVIAGGPKNVRSQHNLKLLNEGKIKREDLLINVPDSIKEG